MALTPLQVWELLCMTRRGFPLRHHLDRHRYDVEWTRAGLGGGSGHSQIFSSALNTLYPFEWGRPDANYDTFGLAIFCRALHWPADPCRPVACRDLAARLIGHAPVLAADEPRLSNWPMRVPDGTDPTNPLAPEWKINSQPCGAFSPMLSDQWMGRPLFQLPGQLDGLLPFIGLSIASADPHQRNEFGLLTII